ncbi:MAG TPA: hypothetical protein DCZ92_14360 [Elusimicrobia bacterium]|nr:MAG: hypothetical protein A2016_08950 [Elusimicrobia bacterium GWF2_62_30]HBA61966.1 hypothetical protein [Elusimicrobiota bacterium]
MKTIVGIKSFREAEYFFANGADSVYCGLFTIPNNRPFCENFSSAAEIERVIRLAGGLGRKVYLAANLMLRRSDYLKTLRLLARLTDKGLAGAIISDPALLAYFKRERFRTHFTLSTLVNCFNTPTLEFFAGLGISRVVLPIQMTPDNARALLANRLGIETEIFCLPLYYSVNVDSHCFLPCPHDGSKKTALFEDYPCLLPFMSPQGDYFMPMPGQEFRLNALYDFYKAGAGYLKVARWPNTRREADLFLKARYLLDLLDRGLARAAFVKRGLELDTKPMEYGKSFTYYPLRG